MKILLMLVAFSVSAAAQTASTSTLAVTESQATAVQNAIDTRAPATPATYSCHTFICPIWKDWSHAQVSAQLLYAPARNFAFDGGSIDAAILYNPAIGSAYWPAAWTNAGIPPPACAFLEIGGGGNSQSAFAHAGASCNLAPVLVGYAVKGLTSAGGNYALLGSFLLAPDGSGLKLSGGIKANVVANGGLESTKSLKGEAVIGVGYVYRFLPQ